MDATTTKIASPIRETTPPPSVVSPRAPTTPTATPTATPITPSTSQPSVVAQQTQDQPLQQHRLQQQLQQQKREIADDDEEEEEQEEEVKAEAAEEDPTEIGIGHNMSVAAVPAAIVHHRHSDPGASSTLSPTSLPFSYEMKPKAAAAAAAAAEMLQSQKIKKLVRRNASDKLKLIQMVHDNPILWDSRLPNFKGAEEEKNRAWEHIGKEFNAPGRRVARAFKSLRESYRRELAHVKLMGNGFKPKWGLYEAMDFLRDVIRERKGGSHAVDQSNMSINLSAFSQHLNNNNKSGLKLNSLHSPFNESAVLNLSKYSSLPTTDDYFYFVKPELGLSTNMNGVGSGGGSSAAAGCGGGSVGGSGGGGGSGSGSGSSSGNGVGIGSIGGPQHHHPLPAHQMHLNGHNDSRVSSTRNDSTQNAAFDDMDGSSLRSGEDASMRNEHYSHDGSDEVEELDAIDADFPYPLILDSNSPVSAVGGIGGGGISGSGSGCHTAVGIGMSAIGKRKRKDMQAMVHDDIDEYEGQMLQQHRHLRQQAGVGHGGSSMDISSAQTVREVLNSKFCGFISAKLNSMEDTEADNLMNKILMLLVQTQTNETK